MKQNCSVLAWKEAIPTFEVVNAGVAGYGTLQEYLYLVSEGIKYQPDLVLLMFYENDLYDNGLSYFVPFGPRPYATLLDHELKIITKPDPAKFLRFTIPVPFRSTLHRRSYLYYFLNTQIYHRVFWNRLKDLHYADLNEVEGAGKFELFYEIAKHIHQYLTTRNVRLVLVLIPTREEISLGKSDSHRLIREFCSLATNFVPFSSRPVQARRTARAVLPTRYSLDSGWASRCCRGNCPAHSTVEKPTKLVVATIHIRISGFQISLGKNINIKGSVTYFWRKH